MKTTMSLLGACVATVLVLGCAAEAEDVESGEGAQSAGPASEVQPTKPLGPQSATCTTREELVFSCTTGNEEKIVLCASKDLSKTAGYLQARVEGKSGVEVSVPEDGVRTKFRTNARVFVTERGSYLQYEDKEADRTYLVYAARREVDSRDEVASAGITLSVNGKAQDHLVCNPGFVSKLDKVLFDKGGFKYDKTEPKIPAVAP